MSAWKCNNGHPLATNTGKKCTVCGRKKPSSFLGKVTKLSLISLGLGGLITGGIIFIPPINEQVFAAQCSNGWVANNPSLADINEQAKLITVKIYSKNTAGSGVIIARENNTYTILTNRHVLTEDSNFQYQVKMPVKEEETNNEGQKYNAQVVKNISFGEDDLALLTVESEENYNVATIAPQNTPISPNDLVYSAGYPYDQNEIIANEGKIIQELEKSFEGGYQIGYTNQIKKGMSGGPVLNKRGELIGINGIFANPLFGKTYLFDDGTVPTKQEQKQMLTSSWGISIHTVIKYDPNSFPPGVVRENNALARQITVYIDGIEKENEGDANGSGVIIAKEGNTYTVLTAAHIFTGKRSKDYINEDPTQFSLPQKSYQILTPDGKCHYLQTKNIRFLDKKYNLDLAVFQFNSNENYTVAKIADYQLAAAENEFIFVSGWYSDSEDNTINRSLEPGYLLSKEQGLFSVRKSSTQTEGYDLVYTNQTKGGMSGGSILDTKGRLIGIHGRSDGDSTYGVTLGYSLGIPIGKFLNISQEIDLIPNNLTVETDQPQATTPAENQEIFDNFTFDIPTEEDDAIKWLNYGNQLWRRFYFTEAIEAYNIAIEKDPTFALSYYAKGIAQRDLAYSTNNQEYYRGALESFENAIFYQENLYEAWREKARLLYTYQAYPDALVAINQAIQLDPNDINLYLIASDVLMSMEDNQYKDKYKEAKRSLDTAINLAQDRQPMLYAQRGYILSLDQQFESAETDFNKAIELDPNSPDGYLDRARFYYNHKQDIDKAEADFTKAIELDPNYADVYYQRGNMRLNWGKYQEAIKDYDQVIRILGDYTAANVYYQRGFAYRWLGDNSNALNDFSKAAQEYQLIKNQTFYNEAEKRAKDLRNGVTRLALYEGKAYNETVQKGSKISIEILELDLKNQSIKIQIAWSQGLYGEGQLSGKIDQNNYVTVQGELFSFDAGGSFNNHVNFQLVDNQIVNATYDFIPKIGNSNIIQTGYFSDVVQTQGEPLKLNEKETENKEVDNSL